MRIVKDNFTTKAGNFYVVEIIINNGSWQISKPTDIFTVMSGQFYCCTPGIATIVWDNEYAEWEEFDVVLRKLIAENYE